MPDDSHSSGERRSLDPFAGIERIGRYEVVRRVGAGAMGVVFEARDQRMGRRVALKVLTRPQGLSDKAFEEYRSRFFREAQTAGSLSHPNIVVVYDVDVDEELDLPFMAMEFLDGLGLDDLLEEGIRMSRAKALDVGVQVAEGLHHAHQRGVVHRDVKPANLVLQSNGKVKILDFGIAKVEASQLTQSGQFLGTPNYVSPEQVRDREVNGQSDLFSLGVILYELLAGKRPFGGKTVMAVAYQLCHVDPPPPSSLRPDIPERVDRLVMQLLRKEPSERPATGAEVAEALRAELRELNVRAEAAGPVTDPGSDVPKELSQTLTVLGSGDSSVEQEMQRGATDPGARPSAPAPSASPPPAASSTPAAPAPRSSPAPGQGAREASRPHRSLDATAPPRPAAGQRGARRRGGPTARGGRARLALGAAAVVLVAVVIIALVAWPDGDAPEPTPPAVQAPASAAEVAREALRSRTFYLPEGGTQGTPLAEPYLHYLGGEHAKAAAEFASVARAHPELAEARLLQGVSLVLADSPAPAIEPLRSVVAEHPRHEAARWYLAQALFATGSDDEALGLVREIASEGGSLADPARRVLEAAD